MSKSKELAKNTLIIFTSKVFTQLISFFLLPLYTKVLPTENYGLLDLITTYTALAIPILSLQLEMGAFRYLIDNRKNQSRKSTIITSSLTLSLFTTLIFSLLFFVITKFIKIPYESFVWFSIIPTLFSSFTLQIARGLGDTINYSIGSALCGTSNILLNLFFILILKTNLSGILLATGISHIVTIVFLFLRLHLYKYINVKAYDKKEASKLIKYSLPLIPNSIIWWIINVSDRTIISIFISMSANGIYAVSNRFSNILSQIYGVFNLSWTESASLHINDEDRNTFFSKTFNSTINLFLSFSTLFISLLPIVFPLIIQPEYHEAYNYIPVLILGMLFNIIVSFIGTIYIAKKLTKEVMLTSLTAGLLNIIINLLFVKYLGIYAASISTILAFASMSIFRYIDVQKYIKLKLDLKTLTPMIFIFTSSIIIYYINTLASSLLFCLLTFIALFRFNKKLIKGLTESILKKLKK